MSSMSKRIRQLSDNEKSDIKEAFELLDTDKDGFLDYYEFKTAMRALGFKVGRSQILAIMRTYDKQSSNKIGYNDFYYIMSDKIVKRNPLDELRYAFKLFTTESETDKITLQDLQQINRRIGFKLKNKEMQSMIEEFDTDQDGCINQNEFIEIMTEPVV